MSSRSRKRQTRMVLALTAAVLLAGALVYTSFGAASEAMSPSALMKTAGNTASSYQLTGNVVPGYRRDGETLLFRVRDRNDDVSVPVRYQGTVPDPFRQGREVIVTVRRQGDQWVGQRDSLITKCPSKFTAQAPEPN